MQRKDRAKRKRGADSLIDNYKKPIRLLHRQLLLIGLLAEDVVDHRVQADVLRNGVGDHAEVVDELVELFPFLAFREDWMEGPVVAPGHGLHHGNGDSGPLVDPMADERPQCHPGRSPILLRCGLRRGLELATLDLKGGD